MYYSGGKEPPALEDQKMDKKLKSTTEIVEAVKLLAEQVEGHQERRGATMTPHQPPMQTYEPPTTHRKDCMCSDCLEADATQWGEYDE